MRPLRVSQRQERDLATIAALGRDALGDLVSQLQSLRIDPLTVEDLRRQLSALVPDDALVEAIATQLISFSFLCRKREEMPATVVDALTRGLRLGSWSDEQKEQWDAVRDLFVELLSIPSLSMLVKTTELSVDYENYLDSARLIVDLRPVFNDSRDQIEAGILSILMRISYLNDEGKHTLITLIDEKDILSLGRACDQALKKVECVKRSMEKWGLRKFEKGAS